MENTRNIFISYSHEDKNKDKWKNIYDLMDKSSFAVNYSEKEDKSECSDQTIWNALFKKIKGSSITILLFTKDLIEENKYKIECRKNKDFLNQGWVYNEISASLRHEKNNDLNGLIMVWENDTVKEQNGQYFFKNPLPEILNLNFKYIINVKYETFLKNPSEYINKAWKKREEYKNNQELLKTIKYEPHNN